MQVMDLMKSVNAIGRDLSMRDAEKAFSTQKVSMLPVVCCNRLVGVLAKSELDRALPSHATTLSQWEMNYLLDELTIAELIKKPLAVSTDMDLTDVVDLAIEKSIFCFPVVNGNTFMGMLYEDTIFRYLSDEARKPALKVEVHIRGKEKKRSSFLKFLGFGGVP